MLASCTRPHSAVDLLPILFRRNLDRHQTAFALGEAIAHVHYLIAQGTIDREPGADGIDRFLARAA